MITYRKNLCVHCFIHMVTRNYQQINLITKDTFMKINNGSLLLRSAKSYAEDFGLQVFPCKGKKPVTKHGYKDATDDFTQIEQWWDEDSTHNIAIATGHGIVVLDVDIDHNAGKYGDETLSHLEEEYGPLPDTWMCLTGGGGVHYYFQCDDPDLTVAAGFLPGLDYRGTGGYVIAPPLIHPASGRRYEWEVNHLPEDTPLAPLPDWLHDLMEPKHKGKRASITPGKTEGNPEEKIPVGTRNDTLFRYGCSLRGKGATTEEIHAALQQKNADLCMSPLSEAEIASIAKSIERYEPGYRQEVLPSIIPPDYSDAGNAEVFTKVYQENLLWAGFNGTIRSGSRTTIVPWHVQSGFRKKCSTVLSSEIKPPIASMQGPLLPMMRVEIPRMKWTRRRRRKFFPDPKNFYPMQKHREGHPASKI